MKEYFRMSSTFIIVATLLFCINRLYEAISCINLPTAYYLSTLEKLTYVVSFGSLIVGLTFLWLALKENGKK